MPSCRAPVNRFVRWPHDATRRPVPPRPCTPWLHARSVHNLWNIVNPMRLAAFLQLGRRRPRSSRSPWTCCGSPDARDQPSRAIGPPPGRGEEAWDAAVPGPRCHIGAVRSTSLAVVGFGQERRSYVAESSMRRHPGGPAVAPSRGRPRATARRQTTITGRHALVRGCRGHRCSGRSRRSGRQRRPTRR